MKKILLVALALVILSGAVFAAIEEDATEDNLPQITVLNYHKVADLDISLAVTPADFEAQMRYLAENNYSVISIDDFYAGITGQKTLPDNPLLITFDDGYSDNYQNAYPILKKYRFPATIFVITDFVGRKDYLSWAELEEMSREGISVESHTVKHSSLTDLTDSELIKELTDSKKAIEDHLHRDVNFIAYPTGAYNLHIAGLVKSAGYKGAFTVKYGNVDGATNLYAIERLPVFHTENTMKSFVERLTYTPLFAGNGWSKN